MVNETHTNSYTGPRLTLEHAIGNILEVEARSNTFKKESELKRLRIVNKSVFGRLLQSTLI